MLPKNYGSVTLVKFPVSLHEETVLTSNLSIKRESKLKTTAQNNFMQGQQTSKLRESSLFPFLGLITSQQGGIQQGHML